MIVNRQIRFVEHIVRKNQLEAIMLNGMIEGKRASVRQRKTFMDWLVGNNGRSTTLKICQERNEHILITNISLTWHLHWIGVAFKALT